jgi:putative transposase
MPAILTAPPTTSPRPLDPPHPAPAGSGRARTLEIRATLSTMIEPEQAFTAPDGLFTRGFWEPGMSSNRILRTVEFKLYPNSAQEESLNRWLSTCCWVYNQALEHRIKAYRRRGKSITRYDQQKLLTEWRSRMEIVRLVPQEFTRGALFRLDRAMQAFFRRTRAGRKQGFPRFRSRHRYDSLEHLRARSYLDTDAVRVPVMGRVNARGRFDLAIGQQKLLRIIRRQSGWYAQVVVDQGECPASASPQSAIGIDVGLTMFATLSNGEKIENPHLLRESERAIKRAQRRVSRRRTGSRNRRKAVKRLALAHEKIAARRKDFAHQESRKLVNRFDFIAIEKLNIKGLARMGRAKSILDAAWGLFLFFLSYKAASAGKTTDAGNPRGTSQECPDCGAIRKKSLSERIHCCPCGCTLCRDVAAAKVILARAARSSGLVLPAEGSASGLTGRPPPEQVGPWKQEVFSFMR